MTKKKLLSIVAETYGEAFPENRTQALAHNNGDTLADFIYLELDENLPDEGDLTAEDAREAYRLMLSACEALMRVLEAIRDFC